MADRTIFYYGLLFCCPYKQEHCGCPLIEIRKMDIEDRIDYYNSITDQEFKNLIYSHLCCHNQQFRKTSKELLSNEVKEE